MKSNQHRQLGMNLFELLVLVIVFLCGSFLGAYLGSRWGIVGWLTGVLLGLVSPVLLLELLSRIHRHYRAPVRPSCRRGTCGWADYKCEALTNKESVFRCRCGDRYLLRGRYFSEILANSTVRPYMVRPWLRNWRPDTQVKSPPAVWTPDVAHDIFRMLKNNDHRSRCSSGNDGE